MLAELPIIVVLMYQVCVLLTCVLEFGASYVMTRFISNFLWQREQAWDAHVLTNVMNLGVFLGLPNYFAIAERKSMKIWYVCL